ncbi:carbohydrate ABC transporter permease [Paenibacillus sp. sgz302251]|uniref:carbohydrate ABC transporter permease n=1 Tax=Paenibacillus sp. sgz302251 TaxID=3414493 RepID=UPI003C7D3A51
MAQAKISKLDLIQKGKALLEESRQQQAHSWQATTMKIMRNIINKIFLYLTLSALSFVFVYPLLFMISQSMMQPSDVADATVQWIPKSLSFLNFDSAFGALGGTATRTYWDAFLNSFIISFGSAALQVLSCAIAGYGFARYRFPGYIFLLSLVLFTFLVPPQTIVVPLYQFFGELGWLNTHFPFIIPSAMGHGLKGALFVLIFIQFFRRMPNVLEEAARIDGAGAFRTYWTIMLPLAKPALLVVFLFSVVWHWNDTFEPNMYLVVPDYYNLSQTLGIFNGQANANLSQATTTLSAAQSIGVAPTLINQILAGALLTILPMLVLYLFTQRHFVESVEKTGIAGE